MTSIVTTSASDPVQAVTYCPCCKRRRDVTAWDMDSYQRYECGTCFHVWNVPDDTNKPANSWARALRTAE